MPNADLENALHHLRVMQDLLVHDRANLDQAQVSATLELLSGSLSRLMSDELCQEKLAELRVFANTPGSEFLRLQILKSLDALDARIRSLFKIRSANTASKVLPLPRSERARRASRSAKKAS